VFERFSERILRTVVWTQREVVGPGCVRLLKLAVVEASGTRLHTRAPGAFCSDSFVWSVAVRARRPGGRPGSEMRRDVESNTVISTKPKRGSVGWDSELRSYHRGRGRGFEEGGVQASRDGGRRAGEHVLRGLLAIREATVLVTKLQVPVARLISKVMVEATFRQ
jgi:hypothetical protein